MPTYQYHCDACGTDFDVVQSMRDDPVGSCTSCSSPAVERVLHPPTVIDATPRTFGSQADRNEGPGRRYWADKQRHDAETAAAGGREKVRELYPHLVSDSSPSYERPYWRDSDEINPKLNDLTPREKVNYIMTGNSAESVVPEI